MTKRSCLIDGFEFKRNRQIFYGSSVKQFNFWRILPPIHTVKKLRKTNVKVHFHGSVNYSRFPTNTPPPSSSSSAADSSRRENSVRENNTLTTSDSNPACHIYFSVCGQRSAEHCGQNQSQNLPIDRVIYFELWVIYFVYCEFYRPFIYTNIISTHSRTPCPFSQQLWPAH